MGFFQYLKNNNNNFELFATEFADEVLDDLISIVGSKEKIYYKCKLEDIDFKSKTFDIITMWAVLEHVYDPLAVFKKYPQY